MEPVTVITAGVLLVGGFAFALFLGIAADRIEAHRYDDSPTHSNPSH
ncbi:MAG: hypothetical protein M0R73_12610 [Dehalococcoidia bacterium]|nr:hypothetical protein [Dehalococcoidia bacterium]